MDLVCIVVVAAVVLMDFSAAVVSFWMDFLMVFLLLFVLYSENVVNAVVDVVAVVDDYVVAYYLVAEKTMIRDIVHLPTCGSSWE